MYFSDLQLCSRLHQKHNGYDIFHPSGKKNRLKGITIEIMLPANMIYKLWKLRNFLNRVEVQWLPYVVSIYKLKFGL